MDNHRIDKAIEHLQKTKELLGGVSKLQKRLDHISAVHHLLHDEENSMYRYVDRPTNEALIEASLDLLEASKAALTLIRGSGFTSNNPTLMKLTAAIAKAERT